MKKGEKRKITAQFGPKRGVNTRRRPLKTVTTSLDALKKYKGSKSRAAISISLPILYVEAIDELVFKKIYDSRSTAIQDAIRNLLLNKYPEILKKRL
jgi:hypothetical protein